MAATTSDRPWSPAPVSAIRAPSPGAWSFPSLSQPASPTSPRRTASPLPDFLALPSAAELSELSAWLDEQAVVASFGSDPHAASNAASKRFSDAGPDAAAPKRRAGAVTPSAPPLGTAQAPIVLHDEEPSGQPLGEALRARISQLELSQLLKAPRSRLPAYLTSLGVPIDARLRPTDITNAYEIAVFLKVSGQRTDREQLTVQGINDYFDRSYPDRSYPDRSRPEHLQSRFDVLLELNRAGYATTLRCLVLALNRRPRQHWTLTTFRNDQPASAAAELGINLPSGAIATPPNHATARHPREPFADEQTTTQRRRRTCIATHRPSIVPVLPYDDPRTPKPPDVSPFVHFSRQLRNLNARDLLRVAQPPRPASLEPIFAAAGMQRDGGLSFWQIERAYDTFAFEVASKAGRNATRATVEDVRTYLDRLRETDQNAFESQLDILMSFEKATGFKTTASPGVVRDAVSGHPRCSLLPIFADGQLQRLADSVG